jgi:hypothetical protein
MFLSGEWYQAVFGGFMIIAVVLLLRCLRLTHSDELRQQIRWALFGFTGYALLRAISTAGDTFKWSTGSFGHQLLVEMLAGITFALAVLVLQTGLLVALLRFRLYDAEIVISRSANVALITLGVAAVFAAAGDALKQIVYNYSGNSNNEGPIIFAAALATIMVNPIQERVQRWSENRFQRHLVLLRDDLPDTVRDMRETASLHEMLEEVLKRIERGVRAVRSAAVVDGRVLQFRDVSLEQVEAWRASNEGKHYKDDICEPSDRLFPLRIPLIPSSDDEAPIGYLLVGPRPDGSIPSKEEQKALAGVSEAIARAIRTVIKREAREQQVSELIAAQARRIDALEALIAGRGKRPRTA